MFFSEMPIPRNVDPAELNRLNEFRTQLQADGLLGSYASLEDLTAKVRTALEHDLEQLVDARQTIVEATPQTSGGPRTPVGARAVVRARFVREGRGRDVIVVENLGSVSAERVSIEVAPIGQGNAPAVLLDEPIERLPAQASVRILIAVSMGVAAQWRVTLRWKEGPNEFSEVQSITVF